MVRVKVLLKQWEWAKRKLTTEEINDEILLAIDSDGKTVLAHGSRDGDLLQELWVWAKEALTTEEIKNSLFFSFRTYRYQFLAHISKVLQPRVVSGYMGVG